MFEKVTFEEYSTVLGRTIVPSADFDSLKLENIQQMKNWLPYVEEVEEDGIDKSVCMMIEVDYIDQQILNGKSDNSVASESIGGHSVSYSSAQRTELEKLNAKSTVDRKLERVKWFCCVNLGVR